MVTLRGKYDKMKVFFTEERFEYVSSMRKSVNWVGDNKKL